MDTVAEERKNKVKLKIREEALKTSKQLTLNLSDSKRDLLEKNSPKATFLYKKESLRSPIPPPNSI